VLKDHAKTTPPLDRFRIQLRGFFEIPLRLSEYCLRGQQSVLGTSRMHLDISQQLFSQFELPRSHTDSDQIGKRLRPVGGRGLTCRDGEVFDTLDCSINVALGLPDYSSNGEDSSEDLEITNAASTRKEFINQQGGLSQVTPPD